MTALVYGMIALGIFGGYVLTSIILFVYPNILHKRKKLSFRARHISHRGGAGEQLENTMTAFQHAHHLGTDMLEIDCHITRDGHVVISHDNILNRSCGDETKITETDLRDLPLLKQCLKLDFFPGHITEGTEDRKIPLLKDVFAAFPDLAINIDIKIDNDELIEKVSDLCKKFNREHLTCWGSRFSLVTKKCHRMNPHIPLFFSLNGVLILMLLFYSGLLPFVPLKESLYEVIMPGIILTQGSSFNLSKKAKFVVRIVDKLLMRPALFSHLEKRGIQTYLWVLNTEQDFQQAFQYGVAGVMTDFPTKLRQFLQENPHYDRMH